MTRSQQSELDELILSLIHSVDAAPATGRAGARGSAVPSASSSAVDALRDRELRVDVLRRLTSALRSAGLLSAHQHALLQTAVASFSPRFLQLVDGFVQCEKAYALAVRSQLRSAATAASPPSSASYGPPPPPPSLCNPSASLDSSRASALPLSSLLSSSTSLQPFSPRQSLLHLLTSALLRSLEEQWLASFMSVPTSLAKRLSREERLSRGLQQEPALVYGEVSFAALAALLWSLRLDSGGVFVDLGSGSGRAVIGALLLHDWDVVRGVELIAALWQASLAVRDKVERERRAGAAIGGGCLSVAADDEQTAAAAGGAEGGGGRRARLLLDRGSFLEEDWSDADVVLANSTCFDEQTMQRIADRGQRLRLGAYGQTRPQHSSGTQQQPLLTLPSALSAAVITFTKKLSSPHFRLLESVQHEMSWGLATAHVHRREEQQPRQQSEAC